MHLRQKSWARPELESCRFFHTNPAVYRGRWQEQFARKQPLHVELGCGKGHFVATLANRHPQINYMAIDLIDAVLGPAKRRIESTYGKHSIDNVALMSFDIERLEGMLSPDDGISRFYINFCNPWPKRRHQKRRLTHPKQLEKYKTLLADGGDIHFKTDNDALFLDSLAYFENAGFTLSNVTDDLHALNDQDNIETEHEKMYTEQGIKIKYLCAHLVSLNGHTETIV